MQTIEQGSDKMKRSLRWAAGTALMVALAAGHVYSGTSEAPAVAKEKGKELSAGQTGTGGAAVPDKYGSSVAERDKKRYENQKRASDRRAAEMKKAEKAKKPADTGSSVVERDKKRYDTQKRAAERRAVEMKKAESGNRDGEKKNPVDEQGQKQAK